MTDQVHCYRCDKPIVTQPVLLELNSRTNRWSDPATPLPEAESQGCFPFGADCATVILAAGGRLTKVRPNGRRRTGRWGQEV